MNKNSDKVATKTISKEAQIRESCHNVAGSFVHLLHIS